MASPEKPAGQDVREVGGSAHETAAPPTQQQSPQPMQQQTPLPTQQRSPEEEARYLARLREWAKDKDTMKPGDGTLGGSGPLLAVSTPGATEGEDQIQRRGTPKVLKKLLRLGKKKTQPSDEEEEQLIPEDDETKEGMAHEKPEASVTRGVVERDREERRAKVEMWKRQMEMGEDQE